MPEYRGHKYTFSSDVRLAAGGFGEVYLGARVDDRAIHVAIKVPLPGILPEEISVFLREADAAARVASPYVVPVVDWGENPAFIAFEYMAGGTLDQELRRRQGDRRFWSETELVRYFRQLAEAMKAINQHVVHRDLKPLNIFVDGDVLKISDFGMAKYVGDLTRSRTFKGGGTALYMAPESFRVETVDWSADQYSLGVVFHEMASLQRPFVGSWDELEKAHLYQRAPGLNASELRISQRLATLVARMLEKQPADRFDSWDAAVSELDVITSRLSVEAVPSPDSLADKVAAGIEQVRARALEQKSAAAEAARRMEEREELVEYWAHRFFAAVHERVQALTENMGEQVIRVEGRGNQGIAGPDRVCTVTFINAKLLIALATIPPEASSDHWGWGRIDLRSNKRLWICNLLLSSSPQPYGSWSQVDLRMFASIRSGTRPEEEDRVGGRYDVVGVDRLVEALNWQALVFQHSMRNVTSLVTFDERPLMFDNLLSDLLTILVEDGPITPVPKPDPRTQRTRQWGPGR